MKSRVEWHIEKRMGTSWECWDGPFKTERLAQKKFDEVYRIDAGAKAQIFRVVKMTAELVPFIERP